MCLLRWQSKEQRRRNSVCLSRLMSLPTSLGQSSSAETNIMSQRRLSHKHPHSSKVVTENRDSPSVTRLLGPDTLDMATVHNGLHPCPWSRLAIHTYTHMRACARVPQGAFLPLEKSGQELVSGNLEQKSQHIVLLIIWLNARFMINEPSYTTQDHPLWNSSTHSGLGPP